MGSWVERTLSETEAGGVASQVHVQINWEELLRSKTDPQPRVPAQGNEASNL